MTWAGKYCRFIADNCPGHADPDRGGCQWWWEGIEEHRDTGEKRIFKDCGIVLQKRLLDEVAMASRSYAAATEDARNVIVHSFVRMMAEAKQTALAKEQEPPLLVLTQ